MATYKAWVVAAAVLARRDEDIYDPCGPGYHYTDLANDVYATGLSGLGGRGGRKIAQTLRAEMTNTKDCKGVFEIYGAGFYVLHNTALAVAIPDVRSVLRILRRRDIRNLSAKIQRLNAQDETVKDEMARLSARKIRIEGRLAKMSAQKVALEEKLARIDSDQ